MSEIGESGFSDNLYEAQPLFFRDEVADWQALRREEFDEINRARMLVPVMLNGERHDVVWLERIGFDKDTGQPKVVYHAACKCIASQECRRDPELSAMFECEGWKDGVVARAQQVSARDQVCFASMAEASLLVDDVDYSGVVPAGFGLDPYDEAILHHLRIVKRQPHQWEGNVMGGMHEIPLLSLITGLKMNLVEERAERLRESGWVELDGPTIALAA